MMLLYIFVEVGLKPVGVYLKIIFLTGCAARSLKSLPICEDFSPSKCADVTGFVKIFAIRDTFLWVRQPQNG